MKILIVEDEKLLADSIKAMLEGRGFQAEAVYDGETGADYAELGVYDLLILDVMMPKLDFSALVEKALLPFEPLFFEKGLRLETEIEPDLHVSGNERALCQCLDILLDNACRHAQSGRVLVRLRRDSRRCELTAANSCPKLSREERREIFRRFYRRDPARSSNAGGYGLGLPIAESIVIQHGGKIACDWEAGEIRFTAALPISE